MAVASSVAVASGAEAVGVVVTSSGVVLVSEVGSSEASVADGDGVGLVVADAVALGVGAGVGVGEEVGLAVGLLVGVGSGGAIVGVGDGVGDGVGLGGGVVGAGAAVTTTVPTIEGWMRQTYSTRPGAVKVWENVLPANMHVPPDVPHRGLESKDPSLAVTECGWLPVWRQVTVSPAATVMLDGA